MTCSLNRVQVFTIFAGLQVYEEYTVRNKSKMATIILNGNINSRCPLFCLAGQLIQGGNMIKKCIDFGKIL